MGPACPTNGYGQVAEIGRLLQPRSRDRRSGARRRGYGRCVRPARPRPESRRNSASSSRHRPWHSLAAEQIGQWFSTKRKPPVCASRVARACSPRARGCAPARRACALSVFARADLGAIGALLIVGAQGEQAIQAVVAEGLLHLAQKIDGQERMGIGEMRIGRLGRPPQRQRPAAGPRFRPAPALGAGEPVGLQPGQMLAHGHGRDAQPGGQQIGGNRALALQEIQHGGPAGAAAGGSCVLTGLLMPRISKDRPCEKQDRRFNFESNSF